MRIDAVVDVLEAGGVLGVWESTIETNRKTFRMNIDDMYSDKIGSIVREITANAWDSHKRAGNDKPFYVHCPTPIRPEFSVRDYGVGMTQAVMEEVYIVIGKSDKDQSDEEVGMWGLGSKSPFAHGDQYEISCFDGAEVRHYGYGISEKGFPTLYLMSVEECDEPCGVRISFSVAAKDFDLFKKAIEHAAIAHDGGFESNIPLKNIGEIAYEGDGWNCYIDSPLATHHGGNAAWYARQGCVLYQISAQQVTLPHDYNHSKRGQAYVIDCPIGTVRMTPSREAIQYDTEVVAYLGSRVEQVLEAMEQAVWDAVKDIESVIEFFATIEKIKPSFITKTYTHPLTLLTAPSVPAKWPGLFFEAAYNGQGRWEFKTPGAIALGTFARSKIVVIGDISALLDPSRDRDEVPTTQQWLTKSETRRISRFVRAYLESKTDKNVLFFMNQDWTDEFWKACFPAVEVEKITFDSLRDAVPRRVVPPKESIKPPIKGIALAKGAGEQKPVFEVLDMVDGEKNTVAWVTSEQYRRQAAALFKVGRRFNLTALYIAAPQAQSVITDKGIPHLRDYIDDEMGDFSFADWYFVKDKLTEYSIKPYIAFLTRLLATAPESYAAIEKAEGAYSTIARAVKRVLAVDMPALNDDEKKAVDALITGDGAQKPETPNDLLALTSIMKSISNNNYYNPTCKFASGLENIKDKARLTAAAKGLIYLQKIIPPTDKYSA